MLMFLLARLLYSGVSARILAVWTWKLHSLHSWQDLKSKTSSLLCGVQSDHETPMRPLASAERSAGCWMERVGCHVYQVSPGRLMVTLFENLCLQILGFYYPIVFGRSFQNKKCYLHTKYQIDSKDAFWCEPRSGGSVLCIFCCSGLRFAMIYLPCKFPKCYISPPSSRCSCCIISTWCRGRDCGWRLPLYLQTASARLCDPSTSGRSSGFPAFVA